MLQLSIILQYLHVTSFKNAFPAVFYSKEFLLTCSQMFVSSLQYNTVQTPSVSHLLPE